MPIHKKSIVNRLSTIVPKKGFTLIELLVVIAIIGILATFIVASFASAQARGRDARRKSDLDAVKKALELAKNDCTGSKWYPAAAGATGQARYSGAGNSLDGFLDDSTLSYIKTLPHDPTKTSGSNFDYHYSMNGTASASATVCLSDSTTRDLAGHPGFSLSALLENVNDPSGGPTGSSQTKCTGVAGVPRAAADIAAGTIAYYVCSD